MGQMGTEISFLKSRQLLLLDLPVYMFLDGLAISQKLEPPLQQQKHKIHSASYTKHLSYVW